ncbi:alpha/beta fold hydrolase [Streptomyces sp. WAC05374]|uniref:alpha/beta fold hydrolase n=1 Tax=Streptomyces sp. WAC05374 TaxID=2487420 RepID=UPI000F87B265|nr:alpha/beta fold hydrolase [Streptomyces sp. WAC05374]RST15918.1 alpha/beta fold hydrolase [Streptomyces sp. WAC05374]TDF54544.1 alpha/beta fold hydrolase [Streptomyces sp. WAC05374]TDF56179.1 alpha/beta fold hydrolase [Streptomyces sp. WAC05374]
MTGYAARRPASYAEGRAAGLPAVVTVAYERWGGGEPLVLLHGVGDDRRVWGAVVPLLAGFDTIALDLPGFGDSPAPDPGVPWGLEAAVAWMGAVFDGLGVERPHVAGHSLGGLVALRLGQAGLARSVTALAPAGFWTGVERRYAYAVLAMSRQGAAARAALRAGRGPRLFSGDVPGVPVTVAWGTRDRLLPPWQAARVKAVIPGARLVPLPRCGHVPMADDPGLVARVLREAACGPPAATDDGT